MLARRKKWRVISPMRSTPWVPQGPHVYVIYLDGVASYIGSTSNLANRLSGYGFRPTARGDGWTCCIRGERIAAREIWLKVKAGRKFGQWLMDEARLIRRLAPPLNRRGTSAVRGGAVCPI